MLARPFLLVALGLILAGPAIADGQPVPDDASPAANPPRDAASLRLERRQSAAALIPQLGNPRYEIREEATKKLSQLGIDAIEALLGAARSENLEVISRAVRALAMIFEADDDVTFDAAEAALEQLSESSSRSAAQRATAVLAPPEPSWTPDTDRRRFRRWKRAVDRIRELGGIVKVMDVNGVSRDLSDVPPAEEYPQLAVRIVKGWKGGAEGLVNLKRMAVRHPLPLVYVTEGVNLPGEAVENIRRAVPNLKIEGRGDAMLGVACSLVGPCRVNHVEPNSAADKAGIQPGDLILKYDGESLADFEGLIKITKRHKPGDKIELEVRRGETTLRIEAQLTGWALELPSETK